MHTTLQTLLPQHGLSRMMGCLVRCEQPWLKNSLIRSFIRHYQVDMTLAVKEDPSDYQSFNAFFTRALKPEKRPIASEATAIVSPVDGSVSQVGDIHQGQIIQAKRINYSLQTLLGGSKTLAEPFQQGKFATFYLSPKDYHRVHMPYAGRLSEMIYVPGRLFSVNTKTTEQLPQLFVRNERVITLFQTTFGPMAIVLVGALLVGSISTVWNGVVTPDRSRQIRHWFYGADKITLNKGEELGQFQLGSTVIVLFPANCMQWLDGLHRDKEVQFGARVGTIIT